MVNPVKMVSSDRLVSREPMESQEHRVMLDPPDQRALMVSKDSLGRLERLDLQGSRVLQALQGRMASRALLETEVPLATQVNLDPMDNLETQVIKELKDLVDKMETEDQLEQWEQLVL